MTEKLEIDLSQELATAEQIEDSQEDISLRGFKELYDSLENAQTLEEAQLYSAAIAYKFSQNIKPYFDPDKLRNAQEKMQTLNISYVFDGVKEQTEAYMEGIKPYSSAFANLKVGTKTFLESFDQTDMKKDVSRELGLKYVREAIEPFFEKPQSPKKSFWNRFGF
ncbi:MAG: hypothetical protein KDJ35_05065 [Alphaproteobacteria bacterium]|nr:hypothetical protein [Alphaproteobacteria bacterium]